MKILNIKQNSPEWDTLRKSHVGASDIGILMEGSEREIYDLLQYKRGLKEKFTTDAMQRGTDMEAEAVEHFIGRERKEKEKATALGDAPYDWLMASFDFLDSEARLLVEVKCPLIVLDMPSEHSHYKRWIWQIQAQLAVSDYERGLLGVYGPGGSRQEWVVRNEDMIRELKIKGKWFYELIVNFGELAAPKELVERYDDEAQEWAELFRSIDGKIKDLEEEKKILRDEGIAIAGDDPFLCNGVKVQRIASKETIDYEAACKAHSIDVSRFKKLPKSPYTWRIIAS
jgi:putative phage-type endonuclease